MNPKSGTEGLWIEGRLPLTVYYEDTDFSGYVYHANYLRFFERGREELIGVEFLKQLFHQGFHFVVGRLEITYQLPAKHADRLEIVTRLLVRDAPITLVEHTAYRLPSAIDGEREKLVAATVKLVGVDANGKTTRMPAHVIDHFRALCFGTGA